MTSDDTGSNNSKIIYGIWCLAVLCLIFGSCVCSPRRRIICSRRIKERRWNVSIDDIQAIERNFRPRYPIDDPRHVVTKEDAEKAKTEFLLEKLKDYTKAIGKDDFVTGTDAEFGEVVKKDEGKRQSLHQSSVHLSDHRRRSLDVITRIKSAFDRSDSGHGDAIVHKDGIIDTTRFDCSQGSEFRDVEQGPSDETEKEMTGAWKNETAEEIDVDAPIRLLKVPSPGIKVRAEVVNNDVAIDIGDARLIFPECSVCLNEFKVGERISWSREANCDHVFHEECILRWFLTLSCKEDAKRRKRSYEIGCKLHCPMCRQEFTDSPIITSASDSGVIE